MSYLECAIPQSLVEACTQGVLVYDPMETCRQVFDVVVLLHVVSRDRNTVVTMLHVVSTERNTVTTVLHVVSVE